MTKPFIILTQGEYSDYNWVGPFYPSKDFTMAEAVECFKNRVVKEEENEDDFYLRDPDKFIAWLIREGWLTEVGATEIHIGGYGELKISEDSLKIKLSAEGSKKLTDMEIDGLMPPLPKSITDLYDPELNDEIRAYSRAAIRAAMQATKEGE